MARGRVGPLGELRIVAAQIDGARRRQDDLEQLRRRLIRAAVADRLPIERIARAARLDVEAVRAVTDQTDPERSAS
ncbi:MAG: hypothetical protein AAGA17_12620 [Actinomycetota bacterium]